MIALLGLAIFAGAAQTPISPVSEVTCAYNPQRIAKILPDLSKAVELKLRVDSSLADDSVMIDVAETKPQELLSRIALVLCAKWEREGADWILAPDRAKLREAGLDELRQRAKAIRNEIKSQEAELGPVDCVENATLTLLSAIGPDYLAGLAFGTRHVLTLNPNPHQEALPGLSADVFAKLVESEWRQKAEHDPGLTSSRPPKIAQAMLMLSIDHERIRSQLVVETAVPDLIRPRPVYLEIHPNAPTPKLHGEALPVDPLVREFYLRAFHVTESGSPVSSTHTTVSKSDGNGPETLFNASSSDSIEENQKISEKLRRRLSDPAGIDPFWTVTEPLERSARLQKANLVAYLPDYAFGPLAKSLASQKLDDNAFLRSVVPASGLEAVETPGWLTILPKEQTYAIRSHIDRAVLAKFLSPLVNPGALPTQEIAEYALAESIPMATEGLDSLYLRALNNRTWGRVFGSLSEPWLTRIYATLTARQASILAARKQLEWRELTSDQQQWADFSYYNSAAEPRLRFLGSTEDSGAQVLLFGHDNERTELMPEGLSGSAVLLIAIDQESGYWATDSRSGVSSLMTSDKLASQRYQRERPEFSSLGTPPNYDSYVPAITQNVDLTFMASSAPVNGHLYGLTFSGHVTGDATAANGQGLRYRDLPSAFQSEVDQKLQRLEQALNDVTFGTRRGKTPPP